MPWTVSLATGLPTSDSEDWDGAAAAASIFAWAGWPDNPDPAKAGKGFVFRNTDDPELKGSFKVPVARVIDGTLTVIKGGVRAAKSRAPQADVPDDVKQRGIARLNTYWDSYDDGENASAGPTLVLEGETPSGHTCFSHDRLQLELLPGESGLVGYLAPKYVLSDRGTYFVNGAFKKTAEEQLSKAHHLYQHWPDLTIGKHTAAEEDRTGFRVTVQINESKQLGADVMSDYRFGIPYGWSIGFDPVRDRSGKEDDDGKLDRSGVPHLKNIPVTELRAIEEVRWWEGSTVTWGAIHSAGPDQIKRRNAFTRADIALLIAAVRDGTLTADQLSQIDELIAARQARAAAGIDHRTPPAPSQEQFAAHLDLLMFELGVTEQAA